MLGPCLMFLSLLWWVVSFWMISLSTSFLMANVICITNLSGSSCGPDLCTYNRVQLCLSILLTSVMLTQWFYLCHDCQTCPFLCPKFSSLQVPLSQSIFIVNVFLFITVIWTCLSWKFQCTFMGNCSNC